MDNPQPRPQEQVHSNPYSVSELACPGGTWKDDVIVGLILASPSKLLELSDLGFHPSMIKNRRMRDIYSYLRQNFLRGKEKDLFEITNDLKAKKIIFSCADLLKADLAVDSACIQAAQRSIAANKITVAPPVDDVLEAEPFEGEVVPL